MNPWLSLLPPLITIAAAIWSKKILPSLLIGLLIGSYVSLAGQHLFSLSARDRAKPLHRFHMAARLLPFVWFVPLCLLPWNPICAGVICLVVGAVASVICPPGFWKKPVIGGFPFLGIYAAFMLSLLWFAPGYIEKSWNLAGLSGGLIYGIPVEELLFGFAVGLYWTVDYEHFTWSKSAAHAVDGGNKTTDRRMSTSSSPDGGEEEHAYAH